MTNVKHSNADQVSRSELERVWDAIDEFRRDFNQEIGELKTAVAVAIAKMKMYPTDRPCEQLKQHLAEHSHTRRTWTDAVIVAVVKYGTAMAFSGLIVYYASRSGNG